VTAWTVPRDAVLLGARSFHWSVTGSDCVLVPYSDNTASVSVALPVIKLRTGEDPAVLPGMNRHSHTARPASPAPRALNLNEQGGRAVTADPGPFIRGPP